MQFRENIHQADGETSAKKGVQHQVGMDHSFSHDVQPWAGEVVEDMNSWASLAMSVKKVTYRVLLKKISAHIVAAVDCALLLLRGLRRAHSGSQISHPMQDSEPLSIMPMLLESSCSC